MQGKLGFLEAGLAYHSWTPGLGKPLRPALDLAICAAMNKAVTANARRNQTPLLSVRIFFMMFSSSCRARPHGQA